MCYENIGLIRDAVLPGVELGGVLEAAGTVSRAAFKLLSSKYGIKGVVKLTHYSNHHTREAQASRRC